MKTIVVGAGAAGLWCALHAAQRGSVALVAPHPAAGSATALAQGGIAAAVAEGDDPEGQRTASLVAWLLARSALRRKESRGGHFRSDFPEPRPEWGLRQTVSREGWAGLPR